MSIHVFVGPTLHGEQLVPDAAVVLRPPAAFGDVIRSVRAGAQGLVLIDGYFEHHAAVWHKEILWALEQGVPVLGAASLGALRAAELRGFGMVGVGQVYALYAARELENDDEVAVAHGTAESGYAPASEALVNMRATLARAVAEGVCSGDEAARFLQIAKSTFYPERTWRGVAEAFERRGDDGGRAVPLARWCERHRVDQKRLDGLAAMEVAVRWAREPERPPTATFRLERTDAWLRALAQAEPSPAELVQGTGASTTPVAPVHEVPRAAFWGAIGRGLALQRVEELGIDPDESSLRMAIARLCRQLDLPGGPSFAEWARAEGLTKQQLWAFVREQAQLAWLEESLEPLYRRHAENHERASRRG